MKKYLLIVIILTISFKLFSQRLSFSVVIDPQVTWLKTDVKNITYDGTVLGFNGGLVLDKYFAENYAFSTGIFLWHAGGKLLFSDSTVVKFRSGEEILEPNTSMTYRLQYITIPFSLKLTSNEIGYVSFFAHLGINNHISVGRTADVPSMEIDDVGIPDEINFFNMSYFFGAGVEYSLGGNTALLGGFYYTNGFWDVTVPKDCRTTLNSIAIRLGVRF